MYKGSGFMDFCFGDLRTNASSLQGMSNSGLGSSGLESQFRV